MSDRPIGVKEHAGIRYLFFSAEWIQGAMRIQHPNSLELAYTREMMTGLLMRDPPWPKNALMIGLGAGSLAKFLYHQFPDTQITVVEINPQVEIIARMYFKLPDDPSRLRILIDDGVKYVLSSESSFDYILVDGFDENGLAGELDTEPFYLACRARLSADGLLSVNLLGRNRGFAASKERIAKAFDGQAFIFPSCDSGNVIAFARGQNAVKDSLDELLSRAQALYKKTGLNLVPTVQRLQKESCLTRNLLSF